MENIVKKFDKAFNYEIQQKTNWHFGKPVQTRIDLNIWRTLFLQDNAGITVRDIDKIIAEELDECINKFAGQTLEQVQAHFDEA
tara:strand:+ start:5444 stop:5695 length:252 start_codon:yes stop_codon:yes gene_type:complete